MRNGNQISHTFSRDPTREGQGNNNTHQFPSLDICHTKPAKITQDNLQLRGSWRNDAFRTYLRATPSETPATLIREAYHHLITQPEPSKPPERHRPRRQMGNKVENSQINHINLSQQNGGKSRHLLPKIIRQPTHGEGDTSMTASKVHAHKDQPDVDTRPEPKDNTMTKKHFHGQNTNMNISLRPTSYDKKHRSTVMRRQRETSIAPAPRQHRAVTSKIAMTTLNGQGRNEGITSNHESINIGPQHMAAEQKKRDGRQPTANIQPQDDETNTIKRKRQHIARRILARRQKFDSDQGNVEPRYRWGLGTSRPMPRR